MFRIQFWLWVSEVVMPGVGIGLFDKKSSMTVRVDKLWLADAQEKTIRNENGKCSCCNISIVLLWNKIQGTEALKQWKTQTAAKFD